MNQFKLLACGRIVFFNRCSAVAPVPGSLKDIGTGTGDFCEDDSTTEPQTSDDSYLGLSHALISDNPSNLCWLHPVEKPVRARRGSKGISSHGRNMIRAGCHWLEEQFGKRNLTFLTATLPDEAMRQCNPETWAIVTNRFLKSLRYHLKGEGLCPEIVGCTEIQEKRLLKTEGVPPLHLHLLFQGRKAYGHWGIDKAEYRRLWSQACRSVWQLGCRFESSCRAESVHTSGVAYMSKYMSKGGNVLTQCNPELLPSAWYTVSMNVKEIIKRTVLRGGNYLAINLYNQLQDSNLLKWSREIYSSPHGDGSQYLVAWVGQIASREAYWELHKEIENCISAFTEIQKREYKFSFGTAC